MKSISNLGVASIARLIDHLRVPLYRNAYALMFSSVATSGLGIVYWMLAARYYPTDVVGLNAAAISALMFLSGVAGLYLDGAFVRFIPCSGPATGRFVGYSYVLSVAVSAVVSVLFLLGLRWWSPELRMFGDNLWLSLGFVFAVATSCIFLLQDGVLIGLRRATLIPIENTLFAVAKIVLLVIFASTLPQLGIFASWVIPALLALVPVNYLIFRRLIPQHQQAEEQLAAAPKPADIVKYVAANYLGSMFILAYTRLLPLMVVEQLGRAPSAYFSLSWMIATSIQLVTINMNQSLIVEGARDQAKLGVYSRRVLVQTTRLIVPIVVLVWVGAPYLLRIFGPDYAAEATGLLRLSTLATIPNIVNGVYFGVARLRQQIGRVLAGQAVVSALVIGLSALWLPRYGITGVGWAYLASQSGVALALVLSQLPSILGRTRSAKPLSQDEKKVT